MKLLRILIIVLMFSSLLYMDAKKIKTSLKIDKEMKGKMKSHDQVIFGREVILDNNTSNLNKEDFTKEGEDLKKCIFSGYEKESNSNLETVLLTNPTEYLIKGFKVMIEYLDMQGRMLHSRELTQICDVPSEETRKFDVKSWDTQHTYYYHLGNSPKKVATPYNVSFIPLAFWVD